MTKRYLTKYALSSGVRLVEMEPTSSNTNSHPHYKWGRYGFAHGEESQGTAEEAEARVRKMIAGQITSLEKTIAKLRAMDPAKMIAEAK